MCCRHAKAAALGRCCMQPLLKCGMARGLTLCVPAKFLAEVVSNGCRPAIRQRSFVDRRIFASFLLPAAHKTEKNHLWFLASLNFGLVCVCVFILSLFSLLFPCSAWSSSTAMSRSGHVRRHPTAAVRCSHRPPRRRPPASQSGRRQGKIGVRATAVRISS